MHYLVQSTVRVRLNLLRNIEGVGNEKSKLRIIEGENKNTKRKKMKMKRERKVRENIRRGRGRRRREIARRGRIRAERIEELYTGSRGGGGGLIHE